MANDDFLLDASDLADIFGVDDAKAGQDFAKSIEDLFLADEDDASAGSVGAALAAHEAAAALPKAPAAPAPAPAQQEEEPKPAEPDRGGMSEEEWRGSPQYAAFKKQVIERLLRQKAADVAAQQAAELKARQDAVEQESKSRAEAEAKAKEEAERRKTELLEKYKAAKAATIAQRARAMVEEQDHAEADAKATDEEKAAKLKGYLADLKSKMAAGSVPPLVLHAKAMAPKLSAASAGLQLDVNQAKLLASMFEETRVEMLKHVGDAIGKKPAQAMMKKTLAKVAKVHLDFYGRAAIDAKNELRIDGQLDEEKLARAIYAQPEDKRLATAQKALFELIEMRFIACELGLGQSTKDKVVTRTLHALEASFAKKAHPAELVKWYFNDVVPSTTMADSDG
jgi:hypothetical protein